MNSSSNQYPNSPTNVVIRSHISKILKNVSTNHHLGSDASDMIGNIMNTAFDRILVASVKIAMNRHGGKRKILKDDVEVAIFSLMPFSLFTFADKQGKSSHHTLSSGLIKKRAIEILENDRQYQKLSKKTIDYIKGVLESLVSFIIQNAATRARIENSKRIVQSHIEATIGRHSDISLMFPQIAIAYWKKQSTNLDSSENTGKKPQKTNVSLRQQNTL